MQGKDAPHCPPRALRLMGKTVQCDKEGRKQEAQKGTKGVATYLEYHGYYLWLSQESDLQA